MKSEKFVETTACTLIAETFPVADHPGFVEVRYALVLDGPAVTIGAMAVLLEPSPRSKAELLHGGYVLVNDLLRDAIGALEAKQPAKATDPAPAATLPVSGKVDALQIELADLRTVYDKLFLERMGIAGGKS